MYLGLPKRDPCAWDVEMASGSRAMAYILVYIGYTKKGMVKMEDVPREGGMMSNFEYMTCQTFSQGSI